MDLKSDGHDVPALYEYPLVDAYTQYYIDAFKVLNKSRGENGISFTDMYSYMQCFEVTDRQTFVEMIQAMDNEVLQYQQRKVDGKA